MQKKLTKQNAFILLILLSIVACASIDNTPQVEMIATSVPIPSKPSAPIIEPKLDMQSFAFSETIYIDAKLNRDCRDYSVKKRSCGAGEALAFSSIAASSNAAKPGVLFLLRAGDYKEVLHVTRSGTENAYLGYSAYPGETVTLLNVNSLDNKEDYGAIWLDQVSYVLINEIDVRGSIGFGRLLNAHYNIISNSEFNESAIWREGRGKSKRGGLYVAFSHYNRIVHNRFYKGTDSLALIHSNHNLVANNRMDLAGHDVWSIKCGSYNVLRNNEFSNENQKLGSVFDCEKATMAWHGNGAFSQPKEVVDSTQFNLIDSNIFKDSVHYYSTSGGNGIQYAGQNGIIRRNVFYHVNVGIGMTSYGQEAAFNYGNRVYNNTFHDNWCVGLAISSPLKKMTDNEYRNNILWNNQGLGASQCAEKNAKQILLRNSKTSGGRFINNNIASSVDEYVIGIWGSERSHSLFSYYLSFGVAEIDDSTQVDPLFKSESNHDYSLQAESPMIDAGAFLTSVISADGSGNQIQLADVKYFYDGYSIPGEVGDKVQIAGRDETATIVKIDYTKQAIILNKPLTWLQGDGIALSYNGVSPDIGARESQ